MLLDWHWHKDWNVARVTTIIIYRFYKRCLTIVYTWSYDHTRLNSTNILPREIRHMSMMKPFKCLVERCWMWRVIAPDSSFEYAIMGLVTVRKKVSTNANQSPVCESRASAAKTRIVVTSARPQIPVHPCIDTACECFPFPFRSNPTPPPPSPFNCHRHWAISMASPTKITIGPGIGNA